MSSLIVVKIERTESVTALTTLPIESLGPFFLKQIKELSFFKETPYILILVDHGIILLCNSYAVYSRIVIVNNDVLNLLVFSIKKVI